MAKKLEVSPNLLLKKFSSQKNSEKIDFKLEGMDISTSQISDALKNLTGKDGVIPQVKPVKNNLKIQGRVVTVSTRQDDWGTSLKAIETAREGEIIFISCDGDDVGVWGELFSTYSQEKGLGGTVIYGAVRDVKAIRDLNYPVFSRSIVPNAGNPSAEGEINIPLDCGGVLVNPGDWVFGDDCGVVLVPENLLKKVINEARKIKQKEEEILGLIQEGALLSDILGI
ncbi:MAG: RraA family protein [Methanobacteriaceae archaeon]|nr:RraA family protein [Methanobacteriaceae archaeon]